MILYAYDTLYSYFFYQFFYFIYKMQIKFSKKLIIKIFCDIFAVFIPVRLLELAYSVREKSLYEDDLQVKLLLIILMLNMSFIKQ